MSSAATANPEVALERADSGAVRLRLRGAWLMRHGVPAPEQIISEIERAKPASVELEGSEVAQWDSGLLNFVLRVADYCAQRDIKLQRDRLPQGVQRLLALAEAVPERSGARREVRRPSWLARVGNWALGLREPLREAIAFIGQIVIALGRLFAGQARFRRTDLLLLIQQAGADALGIVALISFLVGTILAFVGAVQLEQFGASIYVADLVGIAMVREMGAMMTAIVLAGRTGAAYAAQLGTMKVNQEVDALTTMGLSPLEFLVLPRVIALCLMMPLLCLYADLLGMIGGAVVGVGMLKLAPLVYYNQTAAAVDVGDLVGGVFKATVYGVLIALSGCLRGMQCGTSASAVGDAATSAVVTGIVAVVSACGLFAVIFYVLGI